MDYCFVLILQLILILQDPLQLEKREGLKDEGDLMFKLDCIQQQQDIENNRLVYIILYPAAVGYREQQVSLYYIVSSSSRI